MEFLETFPPFANTAAGVEHRELLSRAAHETGERVVVLGRDGVELVVVTAGAGDGHPEESLGEDVNLIVDAVGLVLSDVHGRVCRLVEEPVSGADDRFVEILGRVTSRLG